MLQMSTLSCARSLLVRLDFRLSEFCERSEREISKLSKCPMSKMQESALPREKYCFLQPEEGNAVLSTDPKYEIEGQFQVKHQQPSFFLGRDRAREIAVIVVVVILRASPLLHFFSFFALRERSERRN